MIIRSVGRSVFIKITRARWIRGVALGLILSLLNQLVGTPKLYALTSGPVQSETNSDAGIEVEFVISKGVTLIMPVFTADVPIIERWQCIDNSLTIAENENGIKQRPFNNWFQAIFCGDISNFPLDGTVVSYVYAPDHYRLPIESNENTNGTYSSNDRESILSKTNIETERGYRTVIDSRSNLVGIRKL